MFPQNSFQYFIIFILLTASLDVVSSANSDCVKFGQQFDVPLRSTNVRRECTLPDGRPVCCAAVLSNSTYQEDKSLSSRGIGYSYVNSQALSAERTGSRTGRLRGEAKSRCEVTKVYEPSPQELRDYDKSVELEKYTDQQKKLEELMKYVVSEQTIANSTKWLARVKIHMQSERAPEVCNRIASSRI